MFLNLTSGGPLFCSVGPDWKQFGVASFVAGKGCNSGKTGWFQPFEYESFILPSNIVQNALIAVAFIILLLGGLIFAISSGLLPFSKVRNLEGKKPSETLWKKSESFP